ncbi:MAG: hypothetical protein RL154_1119 [Pseudomonadota bacterium]|jgi:KDO2-lipid IV(A) lauroyltransferase
MIDKIYLALFYGFKFFVKSTPAVVTNAICIFLARLAWIVDIKHRKIIKVNLDLAYENTISEDEKNILIKKAYENMIFLVVDFVKNQGISKEELAKKVEFENIEILERLKDRQIIFITAHYGNWELIALATSGLLNYRGAIVGRALDSKVANEVIKANREQFNIELIDKNGAMKGLIRSIKNGNTVGLLVDQNTADYDGILVNFFSKPVRHTPAASILARRFNTPIVPVFVSTNDRAKFKLKFYEPIMSIKTDNYEDDILRLTQAQADVTEKAIREKPDEWFWFHKRWKNQFEWAYSK